MRDGLRPGEKLMVALGTPGVVYKDLLILGSRTAESLPTPPGDIRAYDARTGAIRWTFHTIPRAGEFGYDTWPTDAWKYIGAANNWAGMTLDTARGLVFVPLGSAADDYYGANRLGDNLFANALVALRAETGERVWHFQFVKHDIWDRDLPSPPNLVVVQRDGRAIDAVAQTTKSGHLFLFERETGTPLWPIEYRRYARSDLAGEVTADSQPLPTFPPPFTRQQFTEDMVTDRTPSAHAAVLERFKKLRSGGQFVPGSREGTVVFPGLDGGAEWGGSAYDPSTSLLYVNSNDVPWTVSLVDADSAPIATGKDLYEAQCASCHGVTLSGVPPAFPSLLNITDRLTSGEIRAIMLDGAGRMPGFAHLTPAQLGAIQRYVANHEQVAALSLPAGSSPVNQSYRARVDRFLDPDGYPAVRPPWGMLSAIDLNTGRYVWRVPLGEYPELVALGMKGTGTENYGGPLVTAGGLLFIGATNHDKKMRAFDKATGELLWEATMAGAGNATPATYQVNGRQFVVIAASNGKGRSAGPTQYVAFALP
jgi:quinoprotein glucose dehydrogenase